MSVINNINNATPVQKIISQPIQKQIPTEAPAQVPLTDRLELSGATHLLQKLKTNDIRVDKVQEIKAQIEAGTYADDDAKLDAAIDKLLDDLDR